MVTASLGWPFATEPNSVTARPYTAIDWLMFSESDFGGGAATTAVGREVAILEPASFDARTRTRSLLPTSTDVSVYVFAVAPMMFEQLTPLASQRRHW